MVANSRPFYSPTAIWEIQELEARVKELDAEVKNLRRTHGWKLATAQEIGAIKNQDRIMLIGDETFDYEVHVFTIDTDHAGAEWLPSSALLIRDSIHWTVYIEDNS